MYTLANLRRYINSDISVTIHKAYLLPAIEIGLYLIDNRQLVEKLQKLQNKALRICLGEPNTAPSYPLPFKVNLQSLDLGQVYTLLHYIDLKVVKGDGTFALDTRTDISTQANDPKLCVITSYRKFYKVLELFQT